METITLKGELTAHRVFGDDFWGIGTLRTADRGAVSINGKLIGASIGDSLIVEGQWTEHPKYGRQFKVTRCQVTIPKDDNGTIAWLAHRLPSIGKKRAREMLDHFGGAEGLWKVIEHSPERLKEIAGITEDRVQQIRAAYQEFCGDRDRMIQFRQWGLTEYQIVAVLKRWGDKAEERLRKNPYDLAKHVKGFGFLKADAIAQRMGVSAESEPRIEAGLVHTMEEASGRGHCYVPSGKLVAMAAEKVLRINGDLVAAQLKKMRKSGQLVAHGPRTFTVGMDKDEATCAAKIAELLRGGGNENG